MTLDKLIEELQLMKERGVEGSAKVYCFVDETGYFEVETIRADSDGDIILEE